MSAYNTGKTYRNKAKCKSKSMTQKNRPLEFLSSLEFLVSFKKYLKVYGYILTVEKI